MDRLSRLHRGALLLAYLGMEWMVIEAAVAVVGMPAPRHRPVTAASLRAFARLPGGPRVTGFLAGACSPGACPCDSAR